MPADPPRWAPRLALSLTLVGLALSGYLTWEHYATGVTLSCPDTGVVDCVKVTTSPQSMVAGVVPVALLGAIFFAAMSAICGPWAWRARSRAVAWLRLAGSVSGIAMVLYLVAVELLVVRAICLWCTAVHVVTFALFITVLAAFVQLPGVPEHVRLARR